MSKRIKTERMNFMINKRVQYFTYYDGILYRLNCMTSNPIKPSIVIYAIGIKLGDFDKKAILLEKGAHGIKCYGQPHPENFHGLSKSEKDKVIQAVTDITPENIRQLPLIWVVELHNGSNMVIPEAKINKPM